MCTSDLTGQNVQWPLFRQIVGQKFNGQFFIKITFDFNDLFFKYGTHVLICCYLEITCLSDVDF